jgi:hypothetical protein
MVFPHSPEVRFTVTVGSLVVHPDPQDAFDQGLLTVSGYLVQSTDASEFASCVNGRGLRHILFKANTPSSNCHCLASIIPSVKIQLGSKKSRENKNRTSSKSLACYPSSHLTIMPSLISYLTNSTHMLMVVMLAIQRLIRHILKRNPIGSF